MGLRGTVPAAFEFIGQASRAAASGAFRWQVPLSWVLNSLLVVRPASWVRCGRVRFVRAALTDFHGTGFGSMNQ